MAYRLRCCAHWSGVPVTFSRGGILRASGHDERGMGAVESPPGETVCLGSMEDNRHRGRGLARRYTCPVGSHARLRFHQLRDVETNNRPSIFTSACFALNSSVRM